MQSAIGDWTGKNVHITLNAAVPTPVQGLLVKVHDSGLLVEMLKGLTFIPVTAILHVSLLAGA